MSADAGVFRPLAARYPGLALTGTPAAAGADVVLAGRLDEAARAALEAGKNVVLLQLSGPKPGTALGWWKQGLQTGTAVARHPAFGNFPHDGYMDEQFFRILGATESLAGAKYRGVEPLMVGRGSAGYLVHVFQARAGKGKLLATGLDLLADVPEAACLLDQMLCYVRGGNFQPCGELDLRSEK